MSQGVCRILIVDDCSADRVVYRRFLERSRHPYEVREIDCGRDARSFGPDHVVDCVLLDYRLPDHDGLELLQHFLHPERGHTLGIVMITGQGDEQVAVEAMKRGAHDYLVKDQLNSETLHRAIQYAIEKAALLRRVEEQHRELQRMVRFDALTGLFTRRYLMERLEEEVSGAERYERPLSLMLLDVDHFKKINDTHGHVEGDEVLVAIGQTIQATLRTSDLAGRYGGEEFCVALPNTAADGARQLAQRLRRAVRELPCSGAGGAPFRISCSVGVAERGSRYPGVRELLRAADDALYRAKRAGRNRVRVARSDSGKPEQDFTSR